MGKYVRGIDMKVESIGSMIKSTKKRYTWEVKIDSRPFTIQYVRSSMSGKDKIFVNGSLVYSHQEYMRKPLNVSLEVDDNKFTVVEYGDTYKLFINSKDFDDYFGHDKVKSIMKKSRMEDEKEPQPANPQGPVNINANRIQQFGSPNQLQCADMRDKRKSHKKVTFNLEEHPSEESCPKSERSLRNHCGEEDKTFMPTPNQASQTFSPQPHPHPSEMNQLGGDCYPIYDSSQLFSSMVNDKHQVGQIGMSNHHSSLSFKPLQHQSPGNSSSHIKVGGTANMSFQESDPTRSHFGVQQHHPQVNANQGHSNSQHFSASWRQSQQGPSVNHNPLNHGLKHNPQTFESYEGSPLKTDIPQTLNFSTVGPPQLPEFPIPKSYHDPPQGSTNPDYKSSLQAQGGPHKQSLSDFLSKQIPIAAGHTSSQGQTHPQGSMHQYSATQATPGVQYSSNSPTQPTVAQHSTHPPSRTMRRKSIPDASSFPQPQPGQYATQSVTPGEQGTYHQPVNAYEAYGNAHAKGHSQVSYPATRASSGMTDGDIHARGWMGGPPAQSGALPHDKPTVHTSQQGNPLARGLAGQAYGNQYSANPLQTPGSQSRGPGYPH
jgi:hypothetical protein